MKIFEKKMKKNLRGIKTRLIFALSNELKE
jgi:hypothetical protein